jgi:hypothetical protein
VLPSMTACSLAFYCSISLVSTGNTYNDEFARAKWSHPNFVSAWKPDFERAASLNNVVEFSFQLKAVDYLYRKGQRCATAKKIDLIVRGAFQLAYNYQFYRIRLATIASVRTPAHHHRGRLK